MSVLVAQLVERPPGQTCVFAKGVFDQVRDPLTQEIPFSKELTDNYCALRFLYESIIIIIIIMLCNIMLFTLS